MQSGILASSELKSAFNALVSVPSSSALLVSITNETLVPVDTLSSTSPFPASLADIPPRLSPTEAKYILVRTSPSPQDFLAITFVPDAAPVRQKMLFASTRLTLIRELGIERFGEQIFATTVEECGPKGWEKHVAHLKVEKPLTEEERANEGIKEAELLESQGTKGREMGGMSLGGGERKGLKRGEGVEGAVSAMGRGEEGTLVVLRIDVAEERIEVDRVEEGVKVGEVRERVSAEEPRYTFYAFRPAGEEVKVVFLYTCPSGSKIKERMVYAASRITVVKMAEQELGLTIAKRLEGSSPADFPEDVIRAEFVQKQEESKGFARPKRPGRR
ncbi:putative cofilin/tropomyosin-type actin-binding protein [Elsinoe fawcettii]|nr:putative cofilin/tropomyosin-type actin-binding protein [Elsinoe fawcettii]